MTYTMLEESIDAVIKRVAAELGSSAPATLKSETDELKSTIVSIIKDHAKLAKFSSDPALMADVYYGADTLYYPFCSSRKHLLNIPFYFFGFFSSKRLSF